MPGSDKRCTTIDFKPIASTTGDPTVPDRVLGAPDSTRRPRSAFAAIDLQKPKEDSVRRLSLLRRPAEFPVVPHGYKLASPWACYRQSYRLRFGIDYWLIGAQQVAKPCDEVLVQQFSSKSNNDGLQRLQELGHKNIHAVLEAFRHGKETYVVFEYMELSLHEVATVGINTEELAEILRQVVDGLVYLAERGVEHGALTCSNFLVSKEGAVKLGECVRCQPRKDKTLGARGLDIVALEKIAAQMMGGYVNHKGVVCLPELERWPYAAASFLADTISATSVHQLQNVSIPKAHDCETNAGQHEFLKFSCMPEQLKSVVSRAIRKARINLEDISP